MNQETSNNTQPTTLTYDDRKIIVSSENYFQLYARLPKILTIVLAALYFIWSIVDPAVFQTEVEVGWRNYETVYGVMQLSSFGLAMIIWWLIGAANCFITYFCTKLLLAYPVLHIYYLKDIRNKLTKN